MKNRARMWRDWREEEYLLAPNIDICASRLPTEDVRQSEQDPSKNMTFLLGDVPSGVYLTREMFKL